MRVKSFLICFVSLILSDSSSGDRNFVKIHEPETQSLHNEYILISYSCSKSNLPKIILADVGLYNEDDQLVYILKRKKWHCDPTKKADIKVRAEKKLTDNKFITETHQKILIRLPYGLRFQPDYFVRSYFYEKRVKIRAWMIDTLSYLRLKKSNAITFSYQSTQFRSVVDVDLKPPYSRPSRLTELSLNFAGTVFYLRDRFPIHACVREDDVIDLVKFPLVMTGERFGKFHDIHKYKNPALEHERTTGLLNFSYEIWLYIQDYCKEWQFCALYQRYEFGLNKYTPNIFITAQGQIHIEVVEKNGKITGATTLIKVPKNEWCRLVIRFTVQSWQAFLNCRSNFTNTMKAEFSMNHISIAYNDVESVGSIGGSSMTPSFVGFIGKFTIYRRKLVELSQLQPVSKVDNFMLSLGRESCEKICLNQLEIIGYAYRRVMADSRCHRFKFGYRKWPMCPRPAVKYLTKLIQDYGKNKLLLGQMLFEQALNIFKDYGQIPQLIERLEFASCLEQGEATFMLATIYSNGLGVKQDKRLSIEYLMKAALNGERLALLSLARKHHVGNDLVKDVDAALYYYRVMSERVKYEIINPIENESTPEVLRLNNQVHLDMVTGETGELFYWLKQQSRRGVDSAQKSLADLMYWGKQGIKRNLEASVNMFRQGAMRNDPQSLHNYGVSLMRGKGVKKDAGMGLRSLESSAKLGYSQSLAVLGQHALDEEKNVAKAIEYWEQGWKKYRDGSCGFFLGLMWAEGLFPNQAKNYANAWHYWSQAANKGQFDSQLKVAHFYAQGNEAMVRQPENAVIWSRFLAEKSSVLGKYLQKGIFSYKDKNWLSSLFYYMLVAETGFEIGSFNAAYLFEEYQTDIANQLNLTDMSYHFYNQSIQPDMNQANGYALNKIGDYYYELAMMKKSSNTMKRSLVSKAMDMYASAYLRGEPQGLFNLALLVEEGAQVPGDIWDRIQIQYWTSRSKYDELKAIYLKCIENSDAYIPCTIALYKLKFNSWEIQGQSVMTFTGILGALLIILPRFLNFN